MQTYLKEFRKGGISKKTVYTVTPEISSDVNEFVLDVVVTTPEVKVFISFVNIKNYVSISANNHLIQDNLF